MVKVLKSVSELIIFVKFLNLYEDLEITEAEYQGKKVKLNGSDSYKRKQIKNLKYMSKMVIQ